MSDEEESSRELRRARDGFAMAALEGLLAHEGAATASAEDRAEIIAADVATSFAYADAMMKARKRTPE